MIKVQRIRKFIKNQTVLCIAFLLAVVSAFFVKPNKEYINYIDFRTISLLFCLMAVVAGWQKAGVFQSLSGKLLSKTNNTRQLVGCLVFICFFSSMVITNDVALITFVPLAILSLKTAGKKKLIIYTVVMQTIAANLGSMLLPVGNPQNLYLFGLSNMEVKDFVLLIFPYWLLSIVLIAIAIGVIKKEKIEVEIASGRMSISTIFFTALFILAMLTVAGVLDYRILLIVTLLSLLMFSRKTILKVDYMLLLTFICFFVFIGNMKQMQPVAQFIEKVLLKREFMVGVLSSQVISNVPAAILLSGFSGNVRELILATDIGGLGTIIASLASLISYNGYMREKDSDGKAYMLMFSLMNILFLSALCLFKILY